MRHVLKIRELTSRRGIYGVPQLSVEWIVLRRATVDEGAAIRQNSHAIAKHVPADRLGSDVSVYRIENSGSQVGVGGEIPRAGDDQHLTVVEKRRMNRINGHGSWQRLPLA